MIVYFKVNGPAKLQKNEVVSFDLDLDDKLDAFLRNTVRNFNLDGSNKVDKRVKDFYALFCTLEKANVTNNNSDLMITEKQDNFLFEFFFVGSF